MASVDEETGLLRRRGNTSNHRGGTNLVVAALAVTSFMLGVATTRNRGDARPMKLDEGNTDDFMWKHVHFDQPPPNVSVANGTIIGSWVGPFGSAAWLRRRAVRFASLCGTESRTPRNRFRTQGSPASGPIPMSLATKGQHPSPPLPPFSPPNKSPLYI